MSITPRSNAFELLRGCDAHVHHRIVNTRTLEYDAYAIELGDERANNEDAGHDILWVLVAPMHDPETWVYLVPGHGDPKAIDEIIVDAFNSYIAAHAHRTNGSS